MRARVVVVTSSGSEVELHIDVSLDLDFIIISRNDCNQGYKLQEV